MMQTICLYCGDHLLGFDLAHVCSRGPRAVKLKTKIQELEDQCWVQVPCDFDMRKGGLNTINTVFDRKKFAELIVQKCAKYAEHAKGTDVEFETYFTSMMFGVE